MLILLILILQTTLSLGLLRLFIVAFILNFSSPSLFPPPHTPSGVWGGWATFLYQILCSSEIAGKRLVENQYCVGSLPVNLGFGQGVSSDSLEIAANASYFKYLI